MAILNPNQSIGNPQGAVGELVYARYADGRVVIRRKPRPETEQTPAEQAVQSRFREAVRYRGRVVADPQKKAPYKTVARILRKRACDMALTDFLKAPVIHDIQTARYTGKAAEPITIAVSDDFEVVSVDVLIRRLDRSQVEEGPAVRESHDRWTYWTRVEVIPGETLSIEVVAADRAGNITVKDVHHALLETGVGQIRYA